MSMYGVTELGTIDRCFCRWGWQIHTLILMYALMVMGKIGISALGELEECLYVMIDSCKS